MLNDTPSSSKLVVRVPRARLGAGGSGKLHVCVSAGTQRFESKSTSVAAELDLDFKALLSPGAEVQQLKFELMRAGFLGPSCVGEATVLLASLKGQSAMETTLTLHPPAGSWSTSSFSAELDVSLLWTTDGAFRQALSSFWLCMENAAELTQGAPASTAQELAASRIQAVMRRRSERALGGDHQLGAGVLPSQLQRPPCPPPSALSPQHPEDPAGLSASWVSKRPGVGEASLRQLAFDVGAVRADIDREKAVRLRTHTETVAARFVYNLVTSRVRRLVAEQA